MLVYARKVFKYKLGRATFQTTHLQDKSTTKKFSFCPARAVVNLTGSLFIHTQMAVNSADYFFVFTQLMKLSKAKQNQFSCA